MSHYSERIFKILQMVLTAMLIELIALVQELYAGRCREAGEAKKLHAVVLHS